MEFALGKTVVLGRNGNKPGQWKWSCWVNPSWVNPN
jgi:hypothetical protein